MPAHEQVIEQIRHTHLTIDKDLDLMSIGNNRRFDLVYEDFCDNPGETLEQIQDFLLKNKCQLNKRVEPQVVSQQDAK